MTDMFSDKTLNPVETELLIRDKKQNIYLVFITRSYFVVPKNARLRSTHQFVKTSKQDPQQILFNHSSDIDFRDVMNLNKTCTAKPYSVLVTDTSLTPDNHLCFTNNLLERI